MSYHKDGWQGVGAIAASEPATRSAPAPLVRAPTGRPQAGSIASLIGAPSLATMKLRAPAGSPMGGGQAQPRLDTTPTTPFQPRAPEPTIGGLPASRLTGGRAVIGTGSPSAPPTSPTRPTPPLPLPGVIIVSGGSSGSSGGSAGPRPLPLPLPTPKPGGSGGGGGGLTIPEDELEEEAELFQPTPSSPPAGMSQGKKVALIVGGVALAYYLYRRSRKP